MADGRAVEVVTALISSLVGTHERHEPPDVDQRTAAWWWGQQDEELAWAHSACRMIARESIGQPVYLARVAEDTTRFRQLKEWGYRVAVEFAGARGSGQRRRSMVESYRTDWGHQAARDGLARALWPHLLDEMPGRDARCKALGVGHQAYQRVQDAVQDRALEAFIAYKADLEAVVEDRWTRDMRGRWEAATGRRFPTA